MTLQEAASILTEIGFDILHRREADPETARFTARDDARRIEALKIGADCLNANDLLRGLR